MLVPEDILASLQKLDIQYDRHEHEAVMTCEAQIAALGSAEGKVTKNLLLKDKKSRLFLVTALSSTPVSLNLLSHRLGTGKGGLRLAPPEDVVDYLQVQPGSLTPLALAATSASGIAFLLDSQIQGEGKICVHPVVNTISLVLAPADLEAFLGSIGRTAQYIDLQAEPVVDREHPPDLKPLADAAVPVPKREESSAAPATPVLEKVAKAAKKQGKETAGQSVKSAPRALDVFALAKTLAAEAIISGGESLEESFVASLNMLRNAAYAQGFAAAKAAPAAALSCAR